MEEFSDKLGAIWYEVCSKNIFMIGKIDPKYLMGPTPLHSPSSSPSGASIDFRSLLKEKLEGSRPPEKMFLEYFTQVMETVLSENPSEGDLFLPSSGFLKSLAQSLPMSLPPVSKVSNYLQEEQDFDQIVEEAARKYGVKPALIKAVIQAESAGNPLAVSPAGAQGLMQLLPDTADELGVKNSFDPVQNIMAGTRYLRQLLDRYRGNVKVALAAYNWGMGNLEKHPEAMPKETKDYIAKVEDYYRLFTKA
jgi:hypothetical protein